MRSRRAAIVTIGNEIVSGDVENTNGSWLARQLAELGVEVRALAALRDEIEQIAAFLAEQTHLDYVFVTGGLGGTPDDVTREAVAAAFGVDCVEIGALAGSLRERFADRGSRRLRGALGVPSGWRRAARQPARRRARLSPRERLRDARPAERDEGDVRVGRRTLPRRARSAPGGGATVPGKARSCGILEEATRLHPRVDVGSYPRFLADGPEVEVVLKCADPAALAEATGWLEAALEDVSAAASQ